MSSTPIQQAKARLPLPSLMEQLDLAEHAKKNARCPLHDDTNPSFSVFQIDNSWLFKCHAGCGEGDEITFLEKHKGISRSDATKLYLEMAGCGPSRQGTWQKLNNGQSHAFDWLHCVNALTDEHLERLGNERSYSRAFCLWLRENKLVGLFKSCIAFCVHNSGTVGSTHYRLEDGSWRYHPQGTKTAPFILGNLAQAKEVHVFESQWDMLAFADRTSNYEARGVVFVATRGASNASLLKDRLPEGASVFAWPQNDQAGEKWLSDLCALVPGLAVVRVPASISELNEFGEKVEVTLKDLNDWTKAGATKDMLSTALAASASEGSGELVRNQSVSPDLASVLEEVTSALQRHITFNSEHQAIVVALWIVHTYLIDYLNTTPYLHITSPVKRCGKSNLLNCLNCLASKPWYLANLSVAVLYRKIERDCPTLLLDEAERSFEGGESGRQDFLAILNCGYKRGATVYRCGGPNRDRLDSFAVFCPKAFAGIGELPDTTQDRCVPIRLERQIPKQRRRFLEEHVEREMTPIRDRLAAWAKTEDAKNKLCITLLDCAFPESLTDRAVEVCEPLFKIAIAAGGDWYKRARDATASIFEAEEDQSQVTSQLAAIRDAFQEDDRLSTSDLIDRLLCQDDSPFPNWWLKENNKRAIGKSLAKILKPFGVKAKKFRIDYEQVRGYERTDLEPVFQRYCTQPSLVKAEPLHVDVLDVSPSVTTNDQHLSAGHLALADRGTDASCPKLSFQYPTTCRRWDMCDIETEEEEVHTI